MSGSPESAEPYGRIALYSPPRLLKHAVVVGEHQVGLLERLVREERVPGKVEDELKAPRGALLKDALRLDVGEIPDRGGEGVAWARGGTAGAADREKCRLRSRSLGLGRIIQHSFTGIPLRVQCLAAATPTRPPLDPSTPLSERGVMTREWPAQPLPCQVLNSCG